jgi:hypothetical protein
MARLEDTMAHAIRVLVRTVESDGRYARGSQVDSAVRYLKVELAEYEKVEPQEVSDG